MIPVLKKYISDARESPLLAKRVRKWKKYRNAKSDMQTILFFLCAINYLYGSSLDHWKNLRDF